MHTIGCATLTVVAYSFFLLLLPFAKIDKATRSYSI